MPRAVKPINPGDRFGLWTICETAEAKMFPSGQYQKQFLCQCDCGTKGLVTYSALVRGKSTSCGCAKERDHSGSRHGRIDILRDSGERRQGSTRIYFVRCTECGTERKKSFSEVKRDGQKRCTCLMTKSEYSALSGQKHGMSRTPEHQAWLGMRQRCNYKSHPSYENYGGKGVRVAPEWDNDRDGFQLFFEHVGPRPHGHSLDRINPFGNYEPGNVRWATKDLQESNKRPRMDPTEITGVFHDRVNGGFYVKFDTKLEARFAYAMSQAKGPHPAFMQRCGHTPESAANILAEAAWLELCGVS